MEARLARKYSIKAFLYSMKLKYLWPLGLRKGWSSNGTGKVLALQPWDAAQAWLTRKKQLRFPHAACLGLGLLSEELAVDLNNKVIQGGRQVSSLKMPPGVLLF